MQEINNNNNNTEWSIEENKQFESALAIYDKDTPDRWLKVAAMIPGKTVFDVIKQYKELEEDLSEIEAGRVPIPCYITSAFTFELISNQNYEGCRKRAATIRGSDQERKKGVPWTEEEHRRFLMGLMKYGKGDWRNIARNFVVTKTPTQVASHAQKYYIRQKDSGGKDKRRPSIHDITTVNLAETTTSYKNNPLLSNESPMSKVQLDCINHYNDGSFMVFDPSCDDLLKLQGQDLYDCAFHEAYSKESKLHIPSFKKASRDFSNEAVFGIHAL
ncbi:hypothetical protein TanjilG_18890 [Lupinus angustifolius]|uniref:Uncharacterized protein n=2 Tax=Lupinus angustifolius TaxID=3871 RepID=A0A4P1RR95_LUPAN|nr:hypothetical protein TanjilG_18890 [Lupinus angustifolius]